MPWLHISIQLPSTPQLKLQLSLSVYICFSTSSSLFPSPILSSKGMSPSSLWLAPTPISPHSRTPTKLPVVYHTHWNLDNATHVVWTSPTPGTLWAGHKEWRASMPPKRIISGLSKVAESLLGPQSGGWCPKEWQLDRGSFLGTKCSIEVVKNSLLLLGVSNPTESKETFKGEGKYFIWYIFQF